MARPERSPTELMARCEAALKVVKRREIITGEPMAELAGMTWRNFVDRYIDVDPQFPIVQRGRPGVPFQFDAAKTLRHLIKRCKERLAESEKRAADMARLANVKMPAANEGAPQSYAELRQGLLAHAELQRMRKEQGEFLLAADVDHWIRGLIERVVMTVNGAAAKSDPTGSWPPEVRGAFDDELRRLASDVQASGDAYIEELNVSHPSQPRRDGRGAGGVGSRKVLRQAH